MKSGNSIIDQVRLLKEKLNQQAKTIVDLKKKLMNQSQVFRQSMNEMQQHEARILGRLHKLEQINLKYIRDYIQIKNQSNIDDYKAIESKFEDGLDSFVQRKYKQIQHEIQPSEIAGSKKLVNNCYSLMKEYLNERQVKYETELQQIISEGITKMKDCKSIGGFKQNKEQTKITDQLKSKIDQFNQTNKTVEGSQVMSQFYVRREIEQSISRLRHNDGMISLSESLDEQKLFEDIIEEVVMAESECNQIGNQFIQESFSFLEEKLESLTQVYGEKFANQKVNEIKGSVKFTKGNVQKQILSAVQVEGSNSMIQIHPQSSFNSMQEQGNYVVNQTSNLMGSIQLKQIAQQYSQLVTTANHSPVLRQRAVVSKSNPINNRLSSAVQSSKTKQFFQQQQRSRDKLITHQNSEIQQHEKVIDKLITFIKKEFKQRKMEDIDGDDPQQLMSYYFKVNEKKYVDIKEEMQELKGEASRKGKQLNKLADELADLTENNQNLTLKLDLQKLEILALSEIYENIRASTIEYHILTSKTEDLVKLSLQTLFNSCLNKITPNLMIEQLQTIIEMIKANMVIKKGITYQLTIHEYIDMQEKEVKKKFSIRAREDTKAIRADRKNSPKTDKKQCSPIIDMIIESDMISKMQPQKIGIKSKPQKAQKESQQIKDKNQKLPQMPEMRKFAIDIDVITSELLNASIQQQSEIDHQLIYDNKSQKSHRVQIQNKIPEIQAPRSSRHCFSEPEKNTPEKEVSSGFDENFIKIMLERIRQIRQTKLDEAIDIEEMYKKYKQALDCLERSENLNKLNEMKFQNFLASLKEKGAWQSPQGLQEKLFYMERVITTQNELLENQRKEYEDTILKQVKQSQQLAHDVIRDIRNQRQNMRG